MRRDHPFDAFQVLVDRRTVATRLCRHCGSEAVVRWGTFSGRQRYRCRDCRRTSSTFTGTALAYSKKPELWAEFAAGMLLGTSVRETGRQLAIDKDTAWRWRHALLAGLMQGRALPLQGVTELLEVAVLVCRKGERALPRPPIPRGRRWPLVPGFHSWAPRGEDSAISGATELALLLLAHDRAGASRAHLRWGAGPPRVADVAQLLGPEATSAQLRLVSRRAHLSAFGRFARQHGLRHDIGDAGGTIAWDLPVVHPRTRSDHHVGTVLGIVLRLRRWLKRFRGVATKYLLRYWAWHRFLDPLGGAQAAKRLLAIAALPLGSAAAR